MPLKSVLFAASEAVPFIKTGGLGEVVGTLPSELRRQGIDARIMIPCYADIASEYQERMEIKAEFPVAVGWRSQSCTIQYCEEDGIPVYFVNNPYYFQRSGIYGHYDDGERFAFFCRAVLEALPKVVFRPDLIHCHDWQAAMICTLLKTHYQQQAFYSKMQTLYTVHNLKYQGVFPKETLGDLWGLGWEQFTPEGLEFYDHINCMKGGLVYSDAVNTVSRTYAEEIRQPFYGEKLEGVLHQQEQKLYGIPNGIDEARFNPASDPALTVNYDWTTWRKKRQNKEAVQQQLGLTVAGDKPVIAMITRFVEPKGLDLVARVLYDILAEDVQFIVMGYGEPQYEHMFQVAAWLYPEKVALRTEFEDDLSRRFFAAADLLLMPSRYEPCGLSQLFAMRYGCLPIVRETGGLKETVIPYNEYTGAGNGFSFTNYNAHDMLHTIRYSLSVFHQNEAGWEELVENAMTADHSWHNTAMEYIQLYDHLAAEGDNLCM